MRIGILQTGHVAPELLEKRGKYSDMFEALLASQGFEFRTWEVVDGDFPTGPDDADGWLITGSRHGAYEDHAFISPLEDLIRAIIGAEKPLIGVCFGHQIIAQALGGKVEKFDGGWTVGPQIYSFADGSTRRLQAWHQDQVTQLPQGAEVLASSPTCDNAVILYPGQAYTVQPHPEFDDVVTDVLIDHRGEAVPDALLDQARTARGGPLDQGALAETFGRFFRTRSL